MQSDNIAKARFLGTRRGIKASSETIEKLRNTALGKKHSEQWKQNHSKMLSGRKLPQWVKDNISKSHLNNPKKQFMQTEEYKQKISNSLKLSKKFQEKMRSAERREKLSKSRKGIIFSAEHIKKLRLAAINRIQKNCGQVNPAYNPTACKIIDEYGKKNGYNFQHAENGGEYCIKELGYWLDGYDKEKNTAIEFDEKKHFTDGELKQKDLLRQAEVKKFLGCKFIRIKYDFTVSED